ncbi:MAG: hypothetical protein LBL08_00540 [Candidatus Nomurabacteria bacterium]|jgi:hypothetical protein|nr:hypothetical protein [Candidatus Nomurabacteria bacterium]
MEKKKFVPYEKLSKRAQREFDKKSRADWGGVDPTTKRFDSDKDYNRADNREIIEKEREDYEED